MLTSCRSMRFRSRLRRIPMHSQPLFAADHACLSTEATVALAALAEGAAPAGNGRGCPSGPRPKRLQDGGLPACAACRRDQDADAGHERCRHVCRSACGAVALKESPEAPRGMPDGVKAEGKALAGVLVLAFRLAAVGVADDALAVWAFGSAPDDGRPLPAAAVSRVKRRLAMFGLPAPVPLDTRRRAWRCACRALRTPGRICP